MTDPAATSPLLTPEATEAAQAHIVRRTATTDEARPVLAAFLAAQDRDHLARVVAAVLVDTLDRPLHDCGRAVVDMLLDGTPPRPDTRQDTGAA